MVDLGLGGRYFFQIYDFYHLYDFYDLFLTDADEEVNK